MYALVCLSFLACAFAAPQYYRPPPPPPPQHYRFPPPPPPPHHYDDPYSMSGYTTRGLFDPKKFFSEFTGEMTRFEQMMEEFLKNFPKTESTSGVQGNKYKINIVLDEFEEKDISVKAREGLIMVQASHKSEDSSERSYLDVRSLPTFVKADSGSWTYEQNVLRIVFPLKENSITTEASETTESTEVKTPEPDREEMENHDSDNTDLDADVGVRGDSDSEIINNEIPNNNEAETVETTTYAVGFNNDVEFVPVQAKK